MNLVRTAGRTLLAGFFVVNGYKAVRDPAAFATSAAPLARSFVPLAQRHLPPSVSAWIPEDTTSLVRLNGALSAAGGLGLATGIGRRVAAALAAVTMVPHVLASNPASAAPAEKAAARSLLVRNLALLGAALMASQDTQGSPSLLWRANDQRVRLAREADQAQAELAREAKKAQAQLKRDAKRLGHKASRKVERTRKSIESALS